VLGLIFFAIFLVHVDYFRKSHDINEKKID